LYCVRQKVQREYKLECTPANAQWRKAVSLHRMQQMVCGQQPVEQAQKKTHSRKRAPVFM